ncbi:formate dehydrogenase accessory sulfurtransferase FdhD [Ruixingdingia sedimenti]|uniref:Sulfur carrier protein FdhD n=1 Tax=Ruixingdingia sedimenti TaxID=3073604 RepID=A0ABU1F478_9RHOB|nr:formate dehydrogenase accessory sulfurtransferase FdhD [Xinfangfangia sp. LG-4]MDR5651665.1 formate dehydrogenase accessory sulfurtransferase FdhD [Xinfangfangia sp. LG-4]
MPPVRQAAARHAVGRTGPPRDLAEETAVALSFDGTTQAVMMATPADLEDFARGFALTEGIAAPGEIDSIAVVEAGPGLDVQVWLRPGAAARLSARRRVMAGPVGCGLCGLDSVAEALRPPPPLPPGGLRLAAADVRAAIAALPGHQPLHDATRAVHAAGFWRPGHGMVAVREDVGRHNALDKLAGALAAAGVPGGAGAVVMTSRLSIDLVQKCARIGAPVLIAASAPTAHAVRLAEGAGLTLCALARAEGFELFTHPGRILTEGIPDVA